MAVPAKTISNNTTFINKIIKHYLKYDKDNPFIFISSFLAFLGIAAGVMVLMLAMGMMHGTKKEWEKSLFVMNYPLTILSINNNLNDKLVEKLSSNFPNLQFSPYYQTAVSSTSSLGMDGFYLYGVDFKREMLINKFLKKAEENAFHTKSKFKVYAGKSLTEKIFIPKGEKITLNFFNQQPIGFGSIPIIQKRFIIDATFESGLNNYDEKILYTTHEAFHKILKRQKGIYDGIHVFSNNPVEDIDKINAFLNEHGYKNGIKVQGWWEQNASLFAAMEMEKTALFLVLLLIILVASLNIISSLLMTVMSRRSEIALMKTLGATSGEIKNIFFRLGTIIGVSGIIAGTILGFIGMWVLTTFPIISLPKDVYGFTKLPIDLTTVDFFSIIIGAFIIVLASSLYPARKASSTDPLTVLRNE